MSYQALNLVIQIHLLGTKAPNTPSVVYFKHLKIDETGAGCQGTHKAKVAGRNLCRFFLLEND